MSVVCDWCATPVVDPHRLVKVYDGPGEGQEVPKWTGHVACLKPWLDDAKPPLA